MTKTSNSSDKYLSLGIDAARAGRRSEARRYLSLALKQSPDHIGTLLWLAFVAPTVQESLGILERVLTLDPDNERAKAGVAWARRQLQEGAPAERQDAISTRSAAEHGHNKEVVQETANDIKVSQTVAGPVRSGPRHYDESLIAKQKVRPKTVKGRQTQSVRRRNLNPLLAASMVLGAAAMIAAGIWFWAFIPPDTLAAWLPATTQIESSTKSEEISTNDLARSDTQVETFETRAVSTTAQTTDGNDPQPQVVQKMDVVAADQEGVGEYDSITLAGNSSTSVAVQTLTAPSLVEFSLETTPPELTAETVNEVAAAPFELFGPVGEAVSGYKLNEPVDESELAHIPAYPGEKWIEVDVTRQTVTAWEGNVPILSFLASTGLPNTPTVVGKFNIYWKLESTLMTGPGYYLPDVPYTMYFYGGYGLHGTYWHDNFGEPMSHGCVNLRNENAKQLFEWADPVIPSGQTQVTSSASNPGTLVVVHK